MFKLLSAYRTATRSLSTHSTLVGLFLCELFIALVITNTQKNLKDNLHFYALIGCAMQVFRVIKKMLLSDTGYTVMRESELAMWTKYQSTDLASRNKNPVQDFITKSRDASYARMQLVTWGFDTMASTIVSFIGLLSIVIQSSYYHLIVILIAANGLWYHLVTARRYVEHGKLRKFQRNLQKSNLPRSKLLAQRIQDFEPDTVKPYVDCRMAVEQACFNTSNEWDRIYMLQQVPNFIVLLAIPYFVGDSSVYPGLVLIFESFTRSLTGCAGFFSRYQKIKDDIQVVDDFFKSSTITEKPPQHPVPPIVTIAVNLPVKRAIVGCAIQSPNLSVVQGDRIHISGNTGCGKTTLIRAMMGYVPGIAFDLTDDPCEYHDDIHYMKQDIRETTITSSTTIRQLFYDETDDQLIARCMTMMECNHLSDRGGFDVEINGKLSGGEKTKLCLSISIYKVLTRKVHWLILDEPEQGIDYQHVPGIIRKIFLNFPNLTIFIITHLGEHEINQLGIKKSWKFSDGLVVQQEQQVV